MRCVSSFSPSLTGSTSCCVVCSLCRASCSEVMALKRSSSDARSAATSRARATAASRSACSPATFASAAAALPCACAMLPCSSATVASRSATSARRFAAATLARECVTHQPASAPMTTARRIVGTTQISMSSALQTPLTISVHLSGECHPQWRRAQLTRYPHSFAETAQNRPFWETNVDIGLGRVDERCGAAGG